MDETRLGVQDFRLQLRDRIDAALERGEHTIVTRNGRPVGAYVPFAWYEHHLPSEPKE